MTITLDQARKLWELGVRKQAYQSWATWEITDEKCVYLTSSCKGMSFKEGKTFYAYNAEELIAMMGGMYQIYIRQDKRVEIYTDPYSDEEAPIYETITQALCNKLIYDIENGIITVEEINARHNKML